MMKEFKKELDSEEGFSPREKEILFENMAKKVLKEPVPLESEEKPKPKKIPDNEVALDSFISLINKAQIKQHTDYILGVVYYLVTQKNYDGVNPKDISIEYKKAYLKPTNTSVYLVNLTKKGLLMPAGEKEGATAFSITRSGIKHMEELLNGE